MNLTTDILNFSRTELAQDLEERLSLEPFRARQLIQWLYKKQSTSFLEMTNISKMVRKQLDDNYRIFRPEMSALQKSVDGTRKFLFRLDDGAEVESVLIKQPKRYTLCVSSQVGCAIGCKFCRTALMGLKRHLSTAEILSQVLAVKDEVRKIATKGEDADFYNIVFMGMGEPFHNYDNVVRAIEILNDELGLDFSARKITVSTSGLVPAIEKFGKSEAQANLAVSLNATTDEIRESLIPINRKWPLDSLLGALREYPLKRGKRITIEYVMLHGVNDNDEDLKRLPGLLRGIPSKVNLIPYNENAGLGYKAPPRAHVAKWQETLLSKGLNSTIRWSKGDDISAACGQLATEGGN